MVSLGKPRSKPILFTPVNLDGLTMYKQNTFGEDLRFRISVSKVLFWKMLRIEPYRE
ncbi:hypothetical protein SDC9_163988 [bioreactor metagenome]|uniref:Uncharacterized protein n=1 Tax=bioreactor metagenome TaxID=1076179 RepID=A0A645FXL0_9ZZZZ|nr:hypothetical protein [Proteiniclasticum sp. QWL-01]UUM11601.1 hypothetical protein NQU17_13305 [Clostridiaceae bacterium HFYG-1003]WFF73081.1 hypothetical protein P6M73_01035 [Proteiniclasticum sp. QWL-01]